MVMTERKEGSATRCPFLNTRKQCTFAKTKKYDCPLLQETECECFNLPQIQYDRMYKLIVRK